MIEIFWNLKILFAITFQCPKYIVTELSSEALRRMELFVFQGRVSECVELPTVVCCSVSKLCLKGLFQLGQSSACGNWEFTFGTIFIRVLLLFFFSCLHFRQTKVMANFKDKKIVFINQVITTASSSSLFICWNIFFQIGVHCHR